MKATHRFLHSQIAAVTASLCLCSSLHAANYYWDTNGTATTPGGALGDVAGIWGTSAFVATVPGGILDGTASTATTATGNADSIQFGTNNLALGSTASTIGIAAGGVTINTIIFGTGQGSQGVTLSGGGGSITLAGNAPSGTPTIAANNTGTNTIGAVLTGTAGMIKAGPGTVVLTGANTYTGTTSVMGGGTLQVGNGTTGNLNNSTVSALTFNNGGGVFHVSRAAGSSQNMGALTASGGDGTVQSTFNGTSASIGFTSLAARASGATLNFVTSGGVNGSTNSITLTGAAAGFINQGTFFGGNQYAWMNAAGTYVRGINYGVDTGSATSAGAASLTGVNHQQITGAITAQNSATFLTLLNNGSNDFTLAASQTVTVNGILQSGGGTSLFSGGTGLRAASNAEMVIRTDTSSDTLTVSTAILANGTNALTKSGAGTLTLSGTNSYTGTTTINSGILAVSGGAAIVDTGAVVLANAAGATLQLSNSETIGSLSGGGISGGDVNVGANTLTIANANNQTFGGKFTGSGAGGVTISSGTLVLANKNTYAGTISLLGTAQLTLGYGNDATSNPLPYSSGGTISMAGGTALNLVPVANVAGGVMSNSVNNINGGQLISNAINITSGAATIQTTAATGYNDTKWVFSGNITGGTSGSQTLWIIPGGAVAPGQGDRQDILFTGVIANGSGGTLGVNVDFRSGSAIAQEQNVNLNAANTFSGNIVVNNTRGLTFSYGGPTSGNNGGYLGIGGEIIRSFSAGRSVTVGSGGLGYVSGSGSGSIYSYSGTIALAAGTALSYNSNASQTLAGEISGGGNLIVEGTGAGTLTLTAANTFAGITTTRAGKIVMAHTLALQNSAYDTTGSNGSTIGIDITSGVSSGTLRLGGLAGNVNLASAFTAGYTASVSSLILNPQAGYSVAYSGNIANSIAGMTLTKNGAGTQIFTGTNTYTGGTTVNAGILQFTNLVSMPAAGSVAVNDGAAIIVGVGGTGQWTTGVSGNGTIGGLLAGLGGQAGSTVGYTGNVGIGFDLGTASAQTYAGNIGNVGSTLGLLVSSPTSPAGTLILSGTNSYTGATTITSGAISVSTLANGGSNSNIGASSNAAGNLILNGGTLIYTGAAASTDRLFSLQSGGTINASGSGAVSFTNTGAMGFNGNTAAKTLTLTGSNAGDNTIASVIGNNTGATSLTKDGLGTWVLTGQNSFTGTTTIRSGTLKLQSGASNITQILGALSNNFGEGTLLSNKSGAGNITTTFGAYSRSAGAAGNILSTGGTNGTSNIVNITGAAGFVNVGLYFNGSEFAALNATNSYVRALAYGTDTNAVAVNTITSSRHVKLTATPGGQASISLLSLNLQGSGVGWTNNASQTLTVPGIIKSGGGTAGLISGGSVSTASNAELVIRTDTAADTLNISSNISLGSGALTKSGEGTLSLSGNNTYSGFTYVTAGLLKLDSATAMPGGITNGTGTNRIILNGGVIGLTAASGNFTRAIGTGVVTNISVNQTGGGFAAFGGDRTVNFGGAGAAINWNASNGSGWGNSGGALMILSHASADGKIIMANGFKFADNISNIMQTVRVDNGSAAIDAEFSGVLENGISATNNGLIKTGTGTLLLSNTNTYTGGTRINQGTLAFANGSLGSTGNITFTGNSTLQWHGSNTQDVSARLVMSNDVTSTLDTKGNDVTFANGIGHGTSGSLIKAGSGALTLSGTNTYTGTTTVSAGTLYVTGALANSEVIVENGAAIGSDGIAGILSNGLTINAGGKLDLTGVTVTSNSSGVLSLTGDLTLGNLTFDDIIGWDWMSAEEGTYKLIAGNFTIDWGSTAFLDAGSAYDFGNGKKGYFESGSLNVVIIPEPSVALLGGLSLLALMRRRRVS